MMLKNKWVEQAFKKAKEMEEEYAQFKVVTTVSVHDVLLFFRTAGRFPNTSEVEGIQRYGIDGVLKAIRLSPNLVPTEEFEKIERLKKTLVQSCGKFLRKFF